MIECYHKTIDARLLKLTVAVVGKIDSNLLLRDRLADNLKRWTNDTLREEWQERLRLPWSELRAQLLAETDSGAALRQSAPLAGILSTTERNTIMREFSWKGIR